MAKEEKSSLVHAQDLSKIEQTGLSKQAKGVLLAPSADKLKAIVWIDGEEVPVLMKQEIKEYFDATEYGNAYLLTVDMPRHQKNILPYRIFKVELTDLENGDRGEGLYYMEKRELYKIKRSGILPLLEPKPGLEPGTYSLRMNCSTN